MKFIDFHTHLDWYEDENSLLKQCETFNGIIISASLNLESFKKTQKLSQKVNNINPKCLIIPTIGVHPQNVLSEINNLKSYDDYLNETALIGEIGMDFCWYKEASLNLQETVFRYFIEHCNKTGKYCVIHTKDAEEIICNILSDYANVKPIIHWYDGPVTIYKEMLNRGYYFTFGCETIRSENIKNLLKITPEDRILAETDNPTAEPWLGGSDNSINLIKRVYSDIAFVLGKSEESINRIINENSYRILKESGIILK